MVVDRCSLQLPEGWASNRRRNCQPITDGPKTARDSSPCGRFATIITCDCLCLCLNPDDGLSLKVDGRASRAIVRQGISRSCHRAARVDGDDFAITFERQYTTTYNYTFRPWCYGFWLARFTPLDRTWRTPVDGDLDFALLRENIHHI